jgi:hypothetical protein
LSQSAKNETTLLCPAEEAWELWRQSGGAPFERVEEVPTSAEGLPESLRGAKVFGFPVRAAFAIPLWVPSLDPEAVRGAMDIHLEKLGLQTDAGSGQVLEFYTVDQTESQTFALAIVLNERQLKSFPGGGIPDQFEVTSALFYLPDNSLVIWKELGKIVAVLTRRDRPIHFQSLGSPTLSPAAVHEIELLLMQLDMQELTGDIEQIVLWTEAVEPDGEAALRKAFGLPVVHQRKPAPALPPEASSFLPRQVAEARQTAARRRRYTQITLAAAAIYLLVAGTFGFFCVRDVLAAKKLKEQRDALERIAGGVGVDRARWLKMLEVTHADRYPLERFFQVTKMLDESSQVRLTKFTFEPNKLIVAGEAENVPKAITYQTALARDPALAEYEWDRAPPRGEKSGNASFQIVGTLKNALPVTP